MMDAQGTVYLKKNPGDANMSIDKLRELINQPLLRNKTLSTMCRYIANIPGTVSNWVNNGKDLDAIIKAKGPPHIFFTFTYADQHEPYLFKLLQLRAGASKAAIKRRIAENPAIVEQYFVQKWEQFVETYLVQRLGCGPKHGGWLWYR